LRLTIGACARRLTAARNADVGEIVVPNGTLPQHALLKRKWRLDWQRSARLRCCDRHRCRLLLLRGWAALLRNFDVAALLRFVALATFAFCSDLRVATTRRVVTFDIIAVMTVLPSNDLPSVARRGSRSLKYSPTAYWL
jgi:hypothetical protein